MSKLIDCYNQKGELLRLPDEDFLPRTAAYAAIERDGNLLAFRLTTGNYFLPGGGVDDGEELLEAMHREVSEEVGGLAVEVIGPLGVFDHFYYYDDSQSAWHSRCHVYVCRIPDAAGIPEGAGQPEEGYPEWVSLAELPRKPLHPGIMAKIVDAYLRWRTVNVHG